MQYQTTFLKILGMVFFQLRFDADLTLADVAKATGMTSSDESNSLELTQLERGQGCNPILFHRMCWLYGMQASTIYRTAELASVWLREIHKVQIREHLDNGVPPHPDVAPDDLLLMAVVRYLPSINLRDEHNIKTEFDPQRFWSEKRLISIDAA